MEEDEFEAVIDQLRACIRKLVPELGEEGVDSAIARVIYHAEREYELVRPFREVAAKQRHDGRTRDKR